MTQRTNKIGWLDNEIALLKKQGLYNEIKVVQSPVNGYIKIDGKKLINLCSNNYLGLANHSQLKKASKKAIDKYGIGPGAVRTIAGTLSLHTKLEKKLAKFKQTQSVITFQSGFVANLGTIPALVGNNDVIFSDELNHASIIDGCRLSRATIVRYEHANPHDLEKKIKTSKGFKKKMIITDGVFSMDGDIAPLDKLYEIAKKHNSLLMVDDAHGEGVLGKNGRGIVDYFKLHGKVDIEVGTMSKAFGVVGGFVAGNKHIIRWLTQRSRPFLFSSAMTVPDVAACIEAVSILEKSDRLVKKLWNNTNYLKDNLAGCGFDTGNSQTPIIPIMLGNAKLAQQFSKYLHKNGVFAMAIGYPTVPKGKARIRVINTATHSKKDLDQALKIFMKVGKKLKVIK